jgi:hypothetical protein
MKPVLLSRTSLPASGAATRAGRGRRLLGWFLGIGLGAPGFAAGTVPDYGSEIRPLFASRCFDCHGAWRQKSGLRVDTAARMIEAGVIVPGEPEASGLLRRLASADPEEIMPPPHEGSPFTPDQVAKIRDWIAAGAPHPEHEEGEPDPTSHWAFRPVRRPPVPDGEASHPVDRFLSRRWRELGLEPAPEASRLELIRRVFLDVIGLPPDPGELETLARDPTPDWYEVLVDRLLDDPRHGERWARHWMDVWRYSDWWGLGDQLRHSQPHIWHWRDWIVESLDANVGYDEMLRLMLAADETHPGDLSRLRASGYLARQFVLFNRNTWMDDTVEHVGKGFLGLTLNCAKCHDHKFDPITQEDYYGLRAVFEPYLVRLDLVPGEADFAKDGIPRAFDALPDVPTYRYLRGNEATPDRSRVIGPAVPTILAGVPFEVRPVALPREAHEPARRTGVLESHLARAETKLAAAVAARDAAVAALAAARARSQPESGSGSPAPSVSDSFATLDPSRWATRGGTWRHRPGEVRQEQDGPTRSRLRYLGATPRDFEAEVRFRIIGGSNYRSVGIAFDAAEGEGAGSGEQLLYVSIGGRKVQAAYEENGVWRYPGGGAIQPFLLRENEECVLRLQVRDTLINASVNGRPVIAWRSPRARRGGFLDVITFDALAGFEEFSLGPLDPKLPLREPGSGADPDPDSVADRAAIAEAALAVARAERESIRCRAAAMRAAWSADAPEAAAAARADAIRAERELDVARARLALTESEGKLRQAAADRSEAAAKDVEKARNALAAAEAKSAAPVAEGERFTPLEGSRWSATRFANSGRDDPAPPFLSESTGRRSALARWLTDRENPLPARVAVNHIWLRHMGQALVPTVFDFGRHGVPPTHPELLDWLAAEFMETGWDMKRLHRLLLTSRAYRMGASASHAGNRAKDPDNRGYWHRPPLRLESQAVRDSILHLAGELDPTRGGPPVPPDQQEGSKRRSLYFFHSNNERNLFLTLFDEARVTECYQREESIVPQQALALANSRLVLESAPKIAARWSEGNAGDDRAFVDRAFSGLLAIRPSEAERAASLRALEDWKNFPGGTSASARTQLVWALLNHHDFVTLR